ncbi:pilus assembly PilX family protein [Rhodoferax aquaticus]|uniref:Pilus assembly protein PilX n=1 Tax=Rhodoferax aquaticus TaxID=2527691 RepID=A0A515EJQ5_9BURK|nr:hypothetical protein [Rhodoferax aquaticus]QDL52898.1 hypothetical protein EXZ61_01195 [Rhodoferax aquaticus]
MSLLVVMVTLTIMLLAIAGMFHANNRTLEIVGNLGFKRNATSVGDIGVEVARAWLLTRTPTQLTATDATAGYFPVWTVGFDPTKYDWDTAGNSVLASADDGTGNAVSYVIHRMCSTAGSLSATGQECVWGNSSTGGSKTQNQNAQGAIKTPFYRITARVLGPRSTLSYIQVMVY